MPARVLVTAADAGGGPHVIVRADTNGDGTADAVTASFMAFDPAFRGGVRVAMGDFDGDGHDELVTAAGPGGGPHVEIWKLDANGAVKGLADSFFAFDPAFRGGCWVATGDFNNDGRDELVVSADAGGGPHVKIYSFNDVGASLVHNQTDSFFAFDPSFTGGARVAVGKFDVSMLSSLQATSPRPMLVVAAGPGGGPHVKIFDNQNFDQRVSDERVIREFMAFDPTFRGGVFVAADNLDRRAAANLVVSAGAGGGPHVRAFHASVVENAMPPIPPSGPPTSLNLEERDSFFAYDLGFTGGVRVALSDLAPTDPNPDLVTAPGSGGRSQVKVWSGDAGTGKVSDRPLEDSFTAFQAPGGTPLDIGVFVAFGST